MVYYCSVKGCKNNSKMKKKDPNIVLSFHAFPVKEVSKHKWLRAIGRPSWKPPSFARICSVHFDLDQISHDGCRIRMMDDACPVKRLPPNSNFEVSGLEVCRICLGTDVKMFNLQEGLLSTCLQSFTCLKENCCIEGLPRFVCYECSARLINCYNLIEQSSIAQAVLLDLFNKNGQVTKRLVKTQDRRALGLESSLQSHITTNLNQYIFKYKGIGLNKYDEGTPATKTNKLDVELQDNFKVISDIEVKISKRDNFHEGLDNGLKKASNDLEITRNKIEEGKKTVFIDCEYAIEESVSENSNEDSSDEFKIDVGIPSEAKPNEEINRSKIAEVRKTVFNDHEFVIKEENTLKKEMEIQSETEDDHIVIQMKGKLKRKQQKKQWECVKDRSVRDCRWKCEECCQQFTSDTAYTNHRTGHDPKTDITKESPKCEECKLDFMSEEARRVHMLISKQHRKIPDFCDPVPANPSTKNSCSKCGVQFLTMKALVSHTKTEHPRLQRRSHTTEGYPVKCEHCEEMLSNRSQHWLHVRRRHPGERHTYRARHNCICHRCGKQFQNSTKLHAHELRHGPAAVQCPSCPRAFHHKYALTRHAATHARPTHACHLCARTFKNKHNLDRHQRVHTGETPYPCNLCDKRFKHSTGLKLHVRSVHCNLPPKRRKLIIESEYYK